VSKKATILATRKHLGKGVRLGAGIHISGARDSPCEVLIIGDNAFIGDSVRIHAPKIFIGDYATIHQRVTIYGYSPVRIGRCVWIGQDAILNCTAPLFIGDGVTLGAGSSVWTHLAGGDVLQGFRLSRAKPAFIGDDSFIAPRAVISPVCIRKRAVVLAGSVVTKDLEGNRIYAGVPATEVTEKLGGHPFEERSLEEKFLILKEKLIAFDKDYKERRKGFAPYLSSSSDYLKVWLGGVEEGVMTGFQAEDASEFSASSILITKRPCYEKEPLSVFSVLDRSFSKRNTPEEVCFMRYLLPAIKFFPMKDEKNDLAIAELAEAFSGYGLNLESLM